MSNFPTTTPIVLLEVEQYIRFWLGNLEESQISSADMQILIAMEVGKYGNTAICKVTYYSTLAVLRWLIREGAKGSSGSVGGGAISKVKEQVGKRVKEVTYDVGTSSGTSSGWDKVLKDLMADPSTIGCNPIDTVVGATSGGSVIIGGSGKDRYDSATPWRQNRLSPTRKTW